MQFESLSAALNMAGHGIYVWPAVILTALIVTGLLVLPLLGSRRLLAELGQQPQVADPPASTSVRIEEVNNASGT
ncbi:MAG: heme exporter protein CcmD [Pseudomonadota bacterium]